MTFTNSEKFFVTIYKFFNVFKISIHLCFKNYSIQGVFKMCVLILTRSRALFEFFTKQRYKLI
jgi:hypothetical protein